MNYSRGSKCSLVCKRKESLVHVYRIDCIGRICVYNFPSTFVEEPNISSKNGRSHLQIQLKKKKVTTHTHIEILKDSTTLTVTSSVPTRIKRVVASTQ